MMSENNQIDGDEISLKELILKIKDWCSFLISKFKTILLFCFIGSLIGISIAFLDKPMYKATLTFTMEEEKSSGGGLSGALGLASSFGIDLGASSAGGGAFSSSNIIELMKSRLIIEKALLNPVVFNNKIISFAEYFVQIHKWRNKWEAKLQEVTFPINGDRQKFSLQQDSLLQKIYKAVTDEKALSIKQKDKKVTIITLEINSKDENFSKMFCENLAAEVSKFYIETKSRKARINVDALQKQADSVRGELNSAINGVAAEADNVYNLNPSLNTKTTPSKKRQVDVQANTAILTQLVAQLEISKVGLRKETPLIQLIDRPILPLEKDKLSKLNSLILGGFLSGFITALYLIFRQMFKKLLD